MKQLLLYLVFATLLLSGCGTTRKTTATQSQSTEHNTIEAQGETLTSETKKGTGTKTVEDQTNTIRTTVTEEKTTTTEYAPPDSTGRQSVVKESTTVKTTTETEEKGTAGKSTEETAITTEKTTATDGAVKIDEKKSFFEESMTETDRDSSRGVQRWTWLIAVIVTGLVLFWFMRR